MARHQTNAVYLTKAEQVLLLDLTKRTGLSPREVTRVKILLLADINGPHALEDQEIAKELGCSLSSVKYRRKRFSDTAAVEDTIFDKPRSGRPTIVDGALDAHMTTIACSTPPEGHSKWTLRMIRDRLVVLDVIDEISHSTVARTLKKKKSNLG